MKIIYTTLVVFFFSILLNAQLINPILVPSSTGPSLLAASNELNIYCTSSDQLTMGPSEIKSRYNCSNSIFFWTEPLLMWDTLEVKREWAARATADAVIAYARAFTYETNSLRKIFLEDKAKKGAEFLLWYISESGNDGGVSEFMPDGALLINDEDKGVFGTGLFASAMVECYLSFGDSKYKTSAIQSAEWLLSNYNKNVFNGDIGSFNRQNGY